jgi:hypothetical protein
MTAPKRPTRSSYGEPKRGMTPKSVTAFLQHISDQGDNNLNRNDAGYRDVAEPVHATPRAKREAGESRRRVGVPQATYSSQHGDARHIPSPGDPSNPKSKAFDPLRLDSPLAAEAETPRRLSDGLEFSHAPPVGKDDTPHVIDQLPHDGRLSSNQRNSATRPVANTQERGLLDQLGLNNRSSPKLGSTIPHLNTKRIAGEELWRISIVGYGERTMNIWLYPSSSISRVKQHYADRFKLSPTMFYLRFRGELLADGLSLRDCDVKPGDTLFMQYENSGLLLFG